MDVIGKWWNGAWGRLVRRDVWLIRETRWVVIARQGGSEDGTSQEWAFEDEYAARGMVDRLKKANGPGQWQEASPGNLTPPLGHRNA